MSGLRVAVLFDTKTAAQYTQHAGLPWQGNTYKKFGLLDGRFESTDSLLPENAEIPLLELLAGLKEFQPHAIVVRERIVGGLALCDFSLQKPGAIVIHKNGVSVAVADMYSLNGKTIQRPIPLLNYVAQIIWVQPDWTMKSFSKIAREMHLALAEETLSKLAPFETVPDPNLQLEEALLEDFSHEGLVVYRNAPKNYEGLFTLLGVVGNYSNKALYLYGHFSGRGATIEVPGYRPQIVVKQKGTLKQLATHLKYCVKDSVEVVKTTVQVFDIVGYAENVFTFRVPQETYRTCISTLKTNNYTIFNEGQVPSVQFQCEHRLKNMSQLRLTPSQVTNLTTSQREASVTVSLRCPVKAIEVIQEPTKALDIKYRTLSLSVVFAGQPARSVQCIALRDSDGGDFVLSRGSMATHQAHIYTYKSEKILLQDFITTLANIDPDVLAGVDLTDLVLPGLVRRMAAHNIKPMLGRTADPVIIASADGRPSSIQRTRNLLGRLVLDVEPSVRPPVHVSFENLEVDSIRQDLVEQAQMQTAAISRTLGESGEVGIHSQLAIIHRCIGLAETGTLSNPMALQRLMAQVNIQELDGAFVFAQPTRTVPGLTTDVKKEEASGDEEDDGEPSKKRVKTEQHSGKYRGGKTLAVEPCVAENVEEFDYRAFYPSEILAHNISPEVCSGCADNIPTFHTTQTGILPRLIEPMFTQRLASKIEMQTKKTPRARQVDTALKLAINVITGALGKLYPSIGGAMTAYARRHFDEAVQKLPVALCAAGAKDVQAIRGDTDGIFFSIAWEPNVASEEAAITGVLSKFNETLPKPVFIERGGRFRRVAVVDRKGYVGLNEKGMHASAIKMKQANCPAYMSALHEKLLTVILGDQSLPEMENSVRVCIAGAYRALMEGRVQAKELAVTFQLNPKGQYRYQPPHHVRLYQRLVTEGFESRPYPNGQIECVYVKANQKTECSLVEEAFRHVIDVGYYIEHYLIKEGSKLLATRFKNPGELFFADLKKMKWETVTQVPRWHVDLEDNAFLPLAPMYECRYCQRVSLSEDQCPCQQVR